MASNNCLLLSQLHVVVLLGLCVTTATASMPIWDEYYSWGSLMNHGHLTPYMEMATRAAVTQWNRLNSGSTRSVMAMHGAVGVWRRVGEDGVTIIRMVLLVRQTFWGGDANLRQRLALITMYMGFPQGRPLDLESVPLDDFHALPLTHVGWIPINP
ncbi:hypothetical protein AXF42_Ash015905 [Apostasia shenzhenica]|uniref:Uncharacterized protein n=1 Tax=Apostasia shenzhenica TaxID=1088818 RepID=A0A2I0AWC2_9ASPA|nr:hypothetical protein AXF42_Ash015905 [Apostasia shenzhenica]